MIQEAEIKKWIKAGEIAASVTRYAKRIIEPEKNLFEIAEKIEAKIKQMHAEPAFPVNLSINEIAAHFTPKWQDEKIATGMIKVDIGVHIDGCIADTAFTLNLDENKEYDLMISAAENAVMKAIEIFSEGTKLRNVGKIIEEVIKKEGFIPVTNLSGHSISRYKLHAGMTIPNFDNGNELQLGEGAYAIEPFVTTAHGAGSVYEGKGSGIYALIKDAPVRDSLARQLLTFIKHKYKTLPFCERWLTHEFGPRATYALHLLEKNRLLYHYPLLIEKSKQPVAQTEHTIILSKNRKIITTKSKEEKD